MRILFIFVNIFILKTKFYLFSNTVIYLMCNVLILTLLIQYKYNYYYYYND